MLNIVMIAASIIKHVHLKQHGFYVQARQSIGGMYMSPLKAELQTLDHVRSCGYRKVVFEGAVTLLTGD